MNMNRLYFFLVRGCAQTLVQRTSLPIVSSHHWLDVLKEIGAMHWGRLLGFYAYMARSNAPLREQYAFHLMLCDTYSSHYPTPWWMIRQIIKAPWLMLWKRIKGVLNKLHWSFVTTPWAVLQVVFVQVQLLPWL